MPQRPVRARFPNGEMVAFVISDINIEKAGYNRHIKLANTPTPVRI